MKRVAWTLFVSLLAFFSYLVVHHRHAHSHEKPPSIASAKKVTDVQVQLAQKGVKEEMVTAIQLAQLKATLAGTTSPRVIDEAELTRDELDALTPRAVEILTGERKAREVLSAWQQRLNPTVLSSLEEVAEMYERGHWTAWCARHGADPSTAPEEVGIPGAVLAPLCAQLPSDAPKAHPPADIKHEGDHHEGDHHVNATLALEKARPSEQSEASVGSTHSDDEAVIVPLAIVVFDREGSREAVEEGLRRGNEFFAGMRWRTGARESRTPPRDGRRPETRFRFYIASFRTVYDDAFARDCGPDKPGNPQQPRDVYRDTVRGAKLAATRCRAARGLAADCLVDSRTGAASSARVALTRRSPDAPPPCPLVLRPRLLPPRSTGRTAKRSSTCMSAR